MAHVTAFDDGPPDWVREHVQRYRETNGEEGHFWNGVPTLLLTTTGRKSGEPQTTPLIYQQDDYGNYVVIGSRGGDDRHPYWYLNIQERPEVELQVGAETFRAVGRDARDPERDALWRRMAAVWPDYDEYAAATDRRIPVVVLEPKND